MNHRSTAKNNSVMLKSDLQLDLSGLMRASRLSGSAAAAVHRETGLHIMLLVMLCELRTRIQ